MKTLTSLDPKIIVSMIKVMDLATILHTVQLVTADLKAPSKELKELIILILVGHMSELLNFRYIWLYKLCKGHYLMSDLS